MKLISMTDFVLKQKDELKLRANLHYYVEAFDLAWKMINYANFLKQTLTLSMFVPTDDDGNVLKEAYEVFERDCTECDEYIFRHQQAKERVIFEGYKVIKFEDYYIIYDSHGRETWVSWNKSKTIESLINEITEVTITPNAVKNYQL